MAQVHTKNAIVYLQGSGATAVTLSLAADVTLTFDYDTVQDNVFGDTYYTRLQGLKKWSGSITAKFDTAQTLLLDAYNQTTPRSLYVYYDRTQTGRYYYGTVWPKLSVKLPIGVAEATAAFEGDGQFGSN